MIVNGKITEKAAFLLEYFVSKIIIYKKHCYCPQMFVIVCGSCEI